MSLQEQTQKIKEKCIAENPSILDIAIGCDVLVRLNATTIRPATIVSTYQDNTVHFVREGRTNPERGLINKAGALRSGESYVDTIFGRQITLSDILLVLGRNTSKQMLVIEAWDLSIPELNFQSVETIELVFEILFPRNDIEQEVEKEEDIDEEEPEDQEEDENQDTLNS